MEKDDKMTNIQEYFFCMYSHNGKMTESLGDHICVKDYHKID